MPKNVRGLDTNAGMETLLYTDAIAMTIAESQRIGLLAMKRYRQNKANNIVNNKVIDLPPPKCDFIIRKYDSADEYKEISTHHVEYGNMTKKDG